MADENSTEFIGEKIYYVRKNKMHMTQEEFAEEVGLSKDSISNFERGKCLPNISNLVQISNKTETPIAFFLNKREE